MKLRTKTIVKFLSLTFFLSSFIFPLYAQNHNTRLLAANTQEGINKNIPNNDPKLQTDIIVQEDLKIEEKTQAKNKIQDYEFQRIDQGSSMNEISEEESSEMEKWIIIFEKEKTKTNNIYSEIVEKEWMKKQTFIIL